MGNRKDYHFGQEILKRKNLLLKRDPLAKKFETALVQYLRKKREGRKPEEIDDQWNRVLSLKRQIQEKWGGVIYIGEAVFRGILPVNSWGLSSSISKIDHAYRVYPRYVGKDAEGRDIIFDFQILGKPDADAPAHYVGEPGELLIKVNTSVIDSLDARELKRRFWEIIKEEVEKRRREHYKKRELPTFQAAFNRVLHMKPEVFDKYLHWYDIHIEKGLSFRFIARYERIRQHNQKNASQLLDLLDGKTGIGACPKHGEHCPPRCDYFIFEEKL